MVRRRALLTVLLACLLLTGCTDALVPSTELHVHNHDERSYEVTLYVVEGDRPTNLAFRATAPDGQRERVGASDLFWDQEQYRNVSLVESDAKHGEATVGPGANVTVTTESGWGERTAVSIVERENGSVVHLDFDTCNNPDFDVDVPVENGDVSGWSSHCKGFP